jgi:hypothetical protein
VGSLVGGVVLLAKWASAGVNGDSPAAPAPAI